MITQVAGGAVTGLDDSFDDDGAGGGAAVFDGYAGLLGFDDFVVAGVDLDVFWDAGCGEVGEDQVAGLGVAGVDGLADVDLVVGGAG